jgi:hypothetical protein
LSFSYSGSMTGGLNRRISMRSSGTLPNAVAALHDRRIAWTVNWNGKDHELVPTLGHTVFVTLADPRNPGAVTYKRLAKAIEIVEPLGTQDPHAIVAGIMKNWNVYDLRRRYPNEWDLADNIAAGAQCIDIVRFVMSVIGVIGCAGDAEAVVIWADPRDPDVPIEARWEGEIGMATVGRHPAHPFWHATLLDGNWHSNNFEAALKFEHGGRRAYYPGGVDAIMSAPLEILHVFKCLAWVLPSGGLKCRIMEVPADYPFGPCPVGSEHECYVP